MSRSRAPKCLPRKRPRYRRPPTTRMMTGSARITPQRHRPPHPPTPHRAANILAPSTLPPVRHHLQTERARACRAKVRWAARLIVGGGAADAARHARSPHSSPLPPQMRQRGTRQQIAPPRLPIRPARTRRAAMQPAAIWHRFSTLMRLRKAVRQRRGQRHVKERHVKVCLAIGRLAAGVDGAARPPELSEQLRRQAHWARHCRRSMPRQERTAMAGLQRRNSSVQTAVPVRKRLRSDPFICGGRCAAVASFLARPACKRVWLRPHQGRWRPNRATPSGEPPPARRAPRASFLVAGAIGIRRREPAKPRPPARDNQSKARRGTPSGSPDTADPAAGPPARAGRTIRKRSAPEKHHTAADPAAKRAPVRLAGGVATATTAVGAAADRADAMDSATEDVTRRRGGSNRSSTRSS